MIDHSLPPDQRRHAPALSVTAVGKEAQRIRVRAPVTAEHRAHPGGAEPAPGERAEIALPAAAAVGAERLRRGGRWRHRPSGTRTPARTGHRDRQPRYRAPARATAALPAGAAACARAADSP